MQKKIAELSNKLDMTAPKVAAPTAVPPYPWTTMPQDASQAQKKDAGKCRMELLPFLALRDVADVLAFGAQKYSAHGWRAGFEWSRAYGATLRHLTSWWMGETNDGETGLNHLAHAACELLFLLEWAHTDAGKDDRP